MDKWLHQAQEDLNWTQANINEKVWYGACFTAQQAAEKALKAYLIDKGTQARKIHDLGALLQQCITQDPNFEVLKEECVTLTDYYAPTRYPDIAEYINFTEDKAKEAYQFARTIVEFIENKLS